MAPSSTTTRSTDRAVLVIHSEKVSESRVNRVAAFLNALEEAYNGLLMFDSFLSNYIGSSESNIPISERGRRRRGFRNVARDQETGEFVIRSSRYLATLTPEALRNAGDYFREDVRLRVRAIEVGSPDFWTVLGSLNPLEQIRKWVDDAHKRRQDRDYKEDAERERLRLENLEKEQKIRQDAERFRQETVEHEQKVEDEELNLELKRMTIFEGKIKIVKQLGARNRDLAPLVKTLVTGPRKRLEQFTDDIIDSADIDSPDAEETDVSSKDREE
jgi:hypothetical protein